MKPSRSRSEATGNPCRHVRYYREKSRERFLTPEEFRRLGAALRRFEARGPTQASAVAALRLLMLTGCRTGEILTLRWDDVDRTAGVLRLRDGKTGPRMVPLTGPVLAVLDGIERMEGVSWVIRSKSDARLTGLFSHWQQIRMDVGLDDVRVHAVHATLIAPTPLVVGNNTFTAPAGTTLAAERSYFLVLQSDATSGLFLAGTTSDDQDAAPGSGWEIADSYRSRDPDSVVSTWASHSSAIKIRVNGTDTGPPYVTAAEVSTDGQRIALTFNEILDHPTYTTTIRSAFTSSPIRLIACFTISVGMPSIRRTISLQPISSIRRKRSTR